MCFNKFVCLFCDGSNKILSMFWAIVLLSNLFGKISTVPCIQRDYGFGSTVCVCNSTYCDDTGLPPQLLMGIGQYLHYETNMEGKKWHWSTRSFNLLPERIINLFDRSIVRFEIKWRRKRQVMLGFGGAMTDSAAINIATLSPEAQDMLIKQYFSSFGIEYCIMRVPMGGSDFSTRHYTYADDIQNDTTLDSFNLSPEDINYRIPMLQKAVRFSKYPIKLFTTGWAAPFWMTEPRVAAKGIVRLQDAYYQLYADYFIKFLNAFREYGLLFWGLTSQNEPTDGLLYYFGFNSLGWTPMEERKFIGYYLGPTLHANGYSDIKIMILDDQRSLLPLWANIVLEDTTVRNYVSGVAVHWYSDWSVLAPPSLASNTFEHFKDKFLLYTEACFTPTDGKPAVPLGSWNNAERLAARMIDAFNNWVVGWVDWNIALDLKGGPNWARNFADSPIIVNSSSDEFYKQPMFYTTAHFSKFILPGSRHIEMLSGNPKGIEYVAFLRPDNVIVIVMLNRKEEEFNAVVTAGLHGNINVKLPPHSIHTILYRNGIFG